MSLTRPAFHGQMPVSEPVCQVSTSGFVEYLVKWLEAIAIEWPLLLGEKQNIVKWRALGLHEVLSLGEQQRLQFCRRDTCPAAALSVCVENLFAQSSILIQLTYTSLSSQCLADIYIYIYCVLQTLSQPPNMMVNYVSHSIGIGSAAEDALLSAGGGAAALGCQLKSIGSTLP